MRLLRALLRRVQTVRTVTAGKAAGLKLAMPYGADVTYGRGTYEAPLQEAVAAHLRPGSVFYDIGANIGFFTVLAARCVEPEGRVYAFEPVPENASSIRRSVHLNGLTTVEVWETAVAAHTGRATLFLARHIGGSTLSSQEMPPDIRGHVDVDTVCIDDLLAQQRVRQPTLVKIDVEGAELGVLRGMERCLLSVRPILIYEVDDATKAGLHRKAENLAAFLSAADYSISVLPPAYPGINWYVRHFLAMP